MEKTASRLLLKQIVRVAFLLVLVVSGAPVSLANDVAVSDITDQIDLTEHLLILDDPTGTLAINDVISLWQSDRFTPLNSQKTQFGGGGGRLWLTWLIRNATAKTETLYLTQEIGVRKIHLYSQKLDGSWRERVAGNIVAKKHWEIKNKLPVFSLILPANKVTRFVAKFESRDQATIAFNLLSPAAFNTSVKNNYFLMGGYYGGLLIVLLFNLMLYLTLRHKSYLSYLIFTFFFMLMQCTLNGLSFEYLWPEFPEWNTRSIGIFSGLTIFGFLYFADHFLDIKKYSRGFWMSNRGLKVWAAALVIYFLLIPMPSLSFNVSIR